MPDIKDFECSICMKLLYRPVTTACGHNFCKFCVDRVSQYASQCPICRTPLNSGYSPNLLLTQVINERFPSEISEREAENRQGLLQNEVDGPRHRFEITPNSPLFPVYCRWNIYPPVFEGDTIHVLIKNEEEYRLMQIAMENNGRLIVAAKGCFSSHKIGSLVEIQNGNVISRDFTLVPHLPTIVCLKGKGRVELMGALTKTGCGWFLSNASPIYDEALVPADDNQGSQFPNLEHQIALKLLRHDSLKDEYLRVVELTREELNLTQKYQLACLLLDMCHALAKRQIEQLHPNSKAIFDDIYGIVPLPSAENPSSSELESLSLMYARMVDASVSTKWRWFMSRDVFSRLVEVLGVLVMSGDRCVLNLSPQSTAIIKIDTLWTCVIVAFVIYFLIKRSIL